MDLISYPLGKVRPIQAGTPQDPGKSVEYLSVKAKLRVLEELGVFWIRQMVRNTGFLKLIKGIL